MAATYLTPGVYVEEVLGGSKPIRGVGTAVAAFVGFTAKAPEPTEDDPLGIKPRLVTNWTQYKDVYGDFAPGCLLPHSVYGYFNNGGGTCYIVRIPAAGPGAPALPSAQLVSQGNPELPTLRVKARDGIPSNDIAVTVEHKEPEGGNATTSFSLRVEAGDREETHTDLSLGGGKRNVETVVNRDSTVITIEALPLSGLSAGQRLPAAGTTTLVVPPPVPAKATSTDIEGDEAERRGIRGLAIAPEVTMVAVPDLATVADGDGGQVDLETWQAVQQALVGHCERAANRVAVLDTPPGLNPQQTLEWRKQSGLDSSYAALYHPWISVDNPLKALDGQPNRIQVPPCGHVAGLWARTDDTRGVWKAPANDTLRGVLDLASGLTKEENGVLNDLRVNCIRSLGPSGIRVWGARTTSSDPEWLYLNVRRLFNFIESSIEAGTQWVVFEPNDLSLWQVVRRNVTSFLTGLWQQGALFGATPAEAFYVKCDAETNPPHQVERGLLVVEVGIAPVRPAEFVIFRISQWSGETAAE